LRNVLSITIHEVCYEELVEDQEQVSRSPIDYLGLEWDDACMAFYRKPRAGRTASHWQVRQPIYKPARQRWKNYAPYQEKLRRNIGYYESDNGSVKDMSEAVSDSDHSVEFSKTE